MLDYHDRYKFQRKLGNRIHQSSPFPVLPPVSQFNTRLFRGRLCLAITCHGDVIENTGSTRHIATPPDNGRARAAGNMHRKFREILSGNF